MGGLGTGAEVAGIGYAVVSGLILIPLSAFALVRSSVAALLVTALVNGVLSMIYLASLDDPEWAVEDTAADVSAGMGAGLHGLAAAAGVVAVICCLLTRRIPPAG